MKIRTSNLIVLLVTVLSLNSLTACSSNFDRETLAQYYTIDSLMNGLYDGITTLSQVQKYGDTGIGTIEGLDGEMFGA